MSQQTKRTSPRGWVIGRFYLCTIIGEACQDVCYGPPQAPPECGTCGFYLDWKESGLTKAQYINKISTGVTTGGEQ